MAEKDSEKKSSANKKRLEPAALAVIDNIVFSKTERWAYYRLQNDVYDFLSHDGKAAAAYKISDALNALISERQESIDCHLVITSVPIDVDAWAAQIKSTSADWNRSPGFERYVEQQVSYLRQAEYLKKVVYLGVKIGRRGALDLTDINVIEQGLKGATDTLKKWWSQALSIPTAEISVNEEDETRRREADVHQTLSIGQFSATRVSSEDLLLLLKRQMYPSMPAPYLDIDHENRLGPGDLSLELGSAIENRYRWLKISQMIDSEEQAGFRACLSFSKFPKAMGYPNRHPFLYIPSLMGLPFTIYSRFTLHPNAKMKSQLEKKRKESADELENAAVAQTSTKAALAGGLPSDVSDSIADLQLMQQLLSEDKLPWAEGSYRIVVEAPTEEYLRAYCSELKQQYASKDIVLSWSSGDQAELFLEQMPGDKLRVKSYNQITNLNFVSTSGFRISSDVGDAVFGSDGEVTF